MNVVFGGCGAQSGGPPVRAALALAERVRQLWNRGLFPGRAGSATRLLESTAAEYNIHLQQDPLREPALRPGRVVSLPVGKPGSLSAAQRGTHSRVVGPPLHANGP